MKKLIFAAALLSTVIGVKAQNISRNCYRGYVDAGYAVGTGNFDFNHFEVNTAHGYQFNPHIFLGGGTGFHFMPSYETPDMTVPLDVRESKVDIPVFANFRWNVLKKYVSPYIDVKGGTYINNNGGMYLNVSAGCRISINEKQAFNISVGAESSELEFETATSLYSRKPAKNSYDSITLKLGFEF